ncbi:cysteine desulfurase [bacterium]|nr:cysteine desulfurase [bacterium]
MKKIYLDHSATTPLDKRVFEAMLPYLTEEFGNPSSLHGYGRSAKVALENARDKIAQMLNSKSNEIVFTAGGSEADNLAILGAAYSPQARGKHFITNRAEHHAVIHSFASLEKNGFEVTYVSCDQYGMVHPDDIAKAIRRDTALVSIMHANNEVGTINPIQEIGEIVRKNGALFHVDAVQAFGKIPIDVNQMNIDLLSMSAHKLYGPKGVGGLFVRSGVKLQPQILGGSQERGQRAGTENIAGVTGFGKAADLCRMEMTDESARLHSMQANLGKAICESISGTQLNGHPDLRLPGHLNVSFDGLMGDEILMMLDLKGIAVSTGSACTSGAVTISHVLKAMGFDDSRSRGAVRMTLGRSSEENDLPYIVDSIENCIEKMRSA